MIFVLFSLSDCLCRKSANQQDQYIQSCFFMDAEWFLHSKYSLQFALTTTSNQAVAQHTELISKNSKTSYHSSLENSFLVILLLFFQVSQSLCYIQLWIKSTAATQYQRSILGFRVNFLPLTWRSAEVS